MIVEFLFQFARISASALGGVKVRIFIFDNTFTIGIVVIWSWYH